MQTLAQTSGSVRTQYGPLWAFLMRRVINPLMQAGLARGVTEKWPN